MESQETYQSSGLFSGTSPDIDEDPLSDILDVISKDVKLKEKVKAVLSTETEDSEAGGLNHSYQKPKLNKKDIKAQINDLRTKIYQNQMMNMAQMNFPGNYPGNFPGHPFMPHMPTECVMKKTE